MYLFVIHKKKRLQPARTYATAQEHFYLHKQYTHQTIPCKEPHPNFYKLHPHGKKRHNRTPSPNAPGEPKINKIIYKKK